MPHAFVTVVVPFEGRRADEVDARLDTLGRDGTLAGALTESAFVHFMSLTAVRDPSGGPAHLVLEASADGHPRGVLNRLAATIGRELGGVLEGAGVRVPVAGLGAFLRRHDRQVGQGWLAVPGVVFTGTPGMSVGRIRREARLASRIQAVLDTLPAQPSALATLARVRAQLFGEGDYKWAFVAEPTPLLAGAPAGWRFVRPVAWSAVRTLLWPLLVLPALLLVWQGPWAAVLALGAELVLGLAAAAVGYARLRRQERTDVPDDTEPSAPAVAEIMAREHNGVQSHLAAVSRLKPGPLRRLTLRLALWAVGAFAAYRSRPGTLSDIGTIHFARWILLPGTDALLFFSAYTGSWESYLEDFIVRAHEGLTGVWSNTRGFPRTRNLVEDGATDGDRFKRWARRQQQPTRCWYSAYPELTTARIRVNAAIRDGFATASTEAEAARWLVGFQWVPPRPSPLEPDGIPTLVFGGLRGLPWSRSLVLRFTGAPEATRGWLAAIEGRIGYGEGDPGDATLALGLSESGLRSLGLDAQALATFPTAFLHGMAAPWRARALGDVGRNAPDRWWWGGPERRADAILNVYARTEAGLEQAIDRLRLPLRRSGIAIVHAVVLDEITPRPSPVREPFGFADGISQPIVRGARRSVVARNAIHVVEPGEMVLGYEDNSGQVPPSPCTPDGRDLGRDGTYLVVRQLEQDRGAFQAYLAEAAARLAGDPRVPAHDVERLSAWIAAKMVGRWPDGTSLVRHPHEPGSGSRPGALPDNDFLFGTEDPDGLRCPFGAHIRRANPRDSFEAGSPAQLRIVNRHRIFRVGRSYGPQNGSPNPGLLFMCVNASIERQFEFVQQTYMLGASFHGLENEVDSFARRDGLSDVLTVPTDRGPLRVRGLGSFITVRGGGYFFMPGRSTLRFLVHGA